MLSVDELLQEPNLPELLTSLNEAWEAEQRRRHEFWADADEGVKAECINGEIIYHSPAYGRHWMASTNLVRYLVPHVYERKPGKVALEKVIIRLTRNDYEPDICFWRTERAKDFGPKQSAFPPPDFVVEILSDSTRERNYGVKLDDYAHHGVDEYWIIDAEAGTVEQYLREDRAFVLAQKLRQGTLTSEVVTGFSIALKELYAE
jgi:Uma2 family endonuclease